MQWGVWEEKEIHGGGMKEEVSWKKEAHKAMRQNSTEENMWRHRCLKNKAKKAVSKAMREKGEEALTELQHCQYGMFRLVISLKIDSKEVEWGRCMRGSDGKLCFSEKIRNKVWKDYMEMKKIIGIMSEEM